MIEITEATAATTAQVARFQEREIAPEDTSSEVQRRIELRVTQSFFDAVRMLANDEGLTKADIIRKAISLYARARIEQKQGNLLAFVKTEEDNKVAVQTIIPFI